MERRFIVCTDEATVEQENKISMFFKNDTGTAFWHWFHAVWLITDPNMKWTPGALRDALRDIVPQCSLLVIEVKEALRWSAVMGLTGAQGLRDIWTKGGSLEWKMPDSH